MSDSRTSLQIALVSVATELDTNIASEARLRCDIETLGRQDATRPWQMAVFGPIGHGKSTLLNALLGQPLLPTDLIPTTGTALRVRYGETLRSRVIFSDGRIREEFGAEAIAQYATLDDSRTMRADVTAVEVSCPHPFLQRGIELLDLPGTNGPEVQDELIKQQLWGADVLVQVLDGRKLMTLGEREHLRDWLQERGLETVVFVVNFLNLIENADRKEVMRRMRFVAEGFRSEWPADAVNVYRVDALPALRASWQGDEVAQAETGLTELIGAIQAIAPMPKQRSEEHLLCLKETAETACNVLKAKVESTAAQIEAAAKRHQEIELQRRGQRLIQQGFTASLADTRQALSAGALCDRFQTELETALRTAQVEQWHSQTLDPFWRERMAALTEWVRRAGDLLQKPVPPEPSAILISAPNVPPVSANTAATSDARPAIEKGDAAVAAATGLGFLMGGPLGAAVLGGASYVLNRSDRDKQSSISPPASQAEEYEPACGDIAQAYLRQFSLKAIEALQQYGAAAASLLSQELTANNESRDRLIASLKVTRAKLSVLKASLKAADPSAKV
ncbi:MAG: dynamin family protein [Cyanobacteria bacterium P01_F01_bin.33]